MQQTGSIGNSFRVKDLFTVPHFRDARLVAGEQGLDKTIRSINVMEVPDVIDWVRPGEFLMTTGYPFRDDPGVLETLIAQLSAKGISALGIKPKRFIDAIPASAIESAERHGLPLIELPPGTTFSEAVREVMERVLVNESKDLTILQVRVQRLSQVLLNGGGPGNFLNHLQAMIGLPVVLLDPANCWIASSEAAERCDRLEDYDWEALRKSIGLGSQTVLNGPEGVRIHVSVLLEDRLQSYLLLVFEQGAGYSAVDVLTVNWAGRLLGLEISNELARKSVEAKYFDQFLQDWIAGRIVSDADLRLRAEACGWQVVDSAVYHVGIASFTGDKPDLRQLMDWAKLLNRDSVFHRNDTKWTVIDGELVVLLTQAGDGVSNCELAAGMLRKIAERRSSVLCFGREAMRREEVSGSYRDAKRAKAIQEACKLEGPVVRYDELGIYMLLYRLLGTEELEVFKRFYLEPILSLEGRSKPPGTLLNTLKTYFACNCNAKETAERMFIHYNTVGYRLERVRSELGFDIDEPETRLMLQLAIKVYEIEQAERSVS